MCSLKNIRRLERSIGALQGPGKNVNSLGFRNRNKNAVEPYCQTRDRDRGQFVWSTQVFRDRECLGALGVRDTRGICESSNPNLNLYG